MKVRRPASRATAGDELGRPAATAAPAKKPRRSSPRTHSGIPADRAVVLDPPRTTRRKPAAAPSPAKVRLPPVAAGARALGMTGLVHTTFLETLPAIVRAGRLLPRNQLPPDCRSPITCTRGFGRKHVFTSALFSISARPDEAWRKAVLRGEGIAMEAARQADPDAPVAHLVFSLRLLDRVPFKAARLWREGMGEIHKESLLACVESDLYGWPVLNEVAFPVIELAFLEKIFVPAGQREQTLAALKAAGPAPEGKRWEEIVVDGTDGLHR